jgi:hypothetical protein
MGNFPSKNILISIFITGVLLILWWVIVEKELLVPKILEPVMEMDLHKLKTGDMLFFRGLSWVEKSIQAYTGCRYNHVSLVIVEDQKTFLWEADVGEGYRKGTRIIPIEEKIQRWGGTSEIAWRSINTVLDSKKILKFASDKLEVPFDKSMMIWMFSWWPREGKKYFCSELVADTLKSLEVLKENKRTTSYSPKDLTKIEGYEPLKVIRK